MDEASASDLENQNIINFADNERYETLRMFSEMLNRQGEGTSRLSVSD
jgi:hypothetical protein